MRAAGTPHHACTHTGATWNHSLCSLLCRYILQTYARPDIVFTHGEGARMYDAYGKEYLDFAAGIAVNALGEPAAALWVLPACGCCCVMLMARITWTLRPALL